MDLTGSLQFRKAESADWPEIWPIFRSIVARGDTYAYSPTIGEDEAKTSWMSSSGLGRSTYVAVLDDEIVATAYVKPNAPGLGAHVANAGWMVAPSVTGRGIGRRFAEWVLAQATGLGFTHMQFNAVVATNEPAIKLWESLGFQIVGTVPEAFTHSSNGPTAIHIMYKKL